MLIWTWIWVDAPNCEEEEDERARKSRRKVRSGDVLRQTGKVRWRRHAGVTTPDEKYAVVGRVGGNFVFQAMLETFPST